MKGMTKPLVLLMVGLSWLGSTVSAQQTADEIMKKSHMAYYYAGDDGVAEVTMTLVSKSGKEREREFTMLRLDNEDGGNQMYYTYFKKPSDVARTSGVNPIPPGGHGLLEGCGGPHQTGSARRFRPDIEPLRGVQVRGTKSGGYSRQFTGNSSGVGSYGSQGIL